MSLSYPILLPAKSGSAWNFSSKRVDFPKQHFLPGLTCQAKSRGNLTKRKISPSIGHTTLSFSVDDNFVLFTQIDPITGAGHVLIM